jgi:type II secretory ATPase GspE/PulE/Tfp pilus assembly ATPase PilB-like protein
MSTEKKGSRTGPERLTYHHSVALGAGERFFQELREGGFPYDINKEWTQEWMAQARRKAGVGPVEFLAEKVGMEENRVLAWGARTSETPIIDTEHVTTGNIPHWIVDGLPLTLLNQTDLGLVTLVHCLPHLHEYLDEELMADIYGAVKVNYILATPANFYKHIERLHSSGRARNRMLARADGEANPVFTKEMEILRSIGLVGKDFSGEPLREVLLHEISKNKPKEGASGETEWHSFASGTPYITLAAIGSSAELLEIMSSKTQKEHSIVPICEYGGLITVASRRPIKASTRTEIIHGLHNPKGAMKNFKMALVMAPVGSIHDIITANLSAVVSTGDLAGGITLETPPEAEEKEEIDIQELANGGEATIIKLVQSLLVGAVNKRATDIHIATHPERTWVRYRLDGVMVEAPFHLAFDFWKAVISRIKIMSQIDIKYSPVPQDGKFPLSVGNDEYDIRVNTCPTVYGEKAVLRLQKKSQTVPTLEGLGFYEHEKRLIENVISSDHGLLIICGPTGSGKCLGKGTPVLKFNGEIVPVEDVKAGDLLMGPDGKPRKVQRTNQGTGPLYEIEPRKGDSWVCNDAHILTLKQTAPNMTKSSVLPGRRVRNEGIYQAFGIKPTHSQRHRLNRHYPEVVDVCLKDFLERTSGKKKVDQHWKLFRTGVEFPCPKEIAEIPEGYFYYLGLWLGDGTAKVNEITNTDPEIIGWIQKFAGEINARFSIEKDERAAHIKTISAKPRAIGQGIKRDKSFPFLYEKSRKKGVCLRTLLACCRETLGGKGRPTLKGAGGGKHIPLWAKTATKTQRLALLAGLLDSDGSLAGNCFDFVNKNREVVEGTVFIARSLGLWGNPAKEKVINGQGYWRTCISGNTEVIPTKAARKQAGPRRQKKDVLRTGWKATPLGGGEYFGFTLDGDGRFLLGDFTVTHNTTTLSATMYSIDRKRWNVITAENPVEIRIPDVEQTPIDGQQLTFGKFVPAALRQDPDYIMIGETRDRETTEEVIRAAITGHIVMTTLHTNSAAGAPGRLIDMGGQPFLITDALKAVCAQRLIRRLCPNCARPAKQFPSEEEIKKMGIRPEWLAGADRLMEPTGCKLCNKTGYRGRIAIIEGYYTNSRIRQIIIHENADTDKIRQEIENQGGKTLFQHAVEHAAKGTTSITEALTVRNLEG